MSKRKLTPEEEAAYVDLAAAAARLREAQARAAEARLVGESVSEPGDKQDAPKRPTAAGSNRK